MLNISSNFVNTIKSNTLKATRPDYNHTNKGVSFKGNLDNDAFVKNTQTPSKEEKVQAAKKLVQQGVKSFENQNFKYCIQILDEAIKTDPENAQAYHCRASANRQLKNFEAAIEDYRKAINLRPDSANSIRLKGQSEASLSETLEKGSHERTALLRIAIDDYDKALELKEEPLTYSLKAKAQMALSQYKEAAESWDSNIQLNEEALAKLEESQTPDSKQIESLKRSLGEAHHIKGNCLRNMAKSPYSSLYEQACEEYTKALEYVPNSANTYYERAKANYRLDSDACEADIRKAIELAPNRPQYWRYLSDFLSQSDDEARRKEGVQAFVRVIELESSKPLV